MANSHQSRTIPTTIAASLDHLTHRPGVVATLILSRRDGTVIRATGILAEKQSNENGLQQNGASAVVENAETITQGEAIEEAAESPKTGPTPLDAFAASVAAFVASATTMSDSLQPSLSSEQSKDGSYRALNGNATQQQGTPAEKDGEQGTMREGDDVQLLRMRTRKHEVVIFPDSKFLSCVVQEVGKPTSNLDSNSRS